MFFTDEMNATVFAQAPYSSRGTPDITDGEDNILGGDAETLTLNPAASGSGYAADFSVGLGAGETTTPADTSVGAALASAKIVRLAGGRRQIRIRLRAKEKVTMAARLTRGGHRLAYRKVTRAGGLAARADQPRLPDQGRGRAAHAQGHRRGRQQEDLQPVAARAEAPPVALRRCPSCRSAATRTCCRRRWRPTRGCCSSRRPSRR